jgi:hypothetical protein
VPDAERYLPAGGLGPIEVNTAHPNPLILQ